MKLANATINDVQHEWQKLFAADLQKRIGDKVKTEIYPASQLGAIPRMVDGVLLGTIESLSPRYRLPDARLDPRFQIFDVPGLFVSPEHVHAVIHDPAYRDHMADYVSQPRPSHRSAPSITAHRAAHQAARAYA